VLALDSFSRSIDNNPMVGEKRGRGIDRRASHIRPLIKLERSIKTFFKKRDDVRNHKTDTL
jgi:hypothetical protein